MEELHGSPVDVPPYSSVLVVIRNNPNSLPFTKPAIEVLDLFVAVLNDSIKRITKKESHITIQQNLENNFFLANSTLGTLEDYIILLNIDGQVIAWNRDLSSLLGSSNSNSSSSLSVENGSLKRGLSKTGSHNKILEIHKGKHLTYFFKGSQFKGLISDLIKAIGDKSGTVNILNTAFINSSAYPKGIDIEYHFLSLDTKNGDNVHESQEGVVLVIRTDNNMKNKNNNLLSPSKDKFVIHKNNGNTRNMLVNVDINDSEDIFSWEFNVLKIKDKNGLVNALGRIFENLLLLDNLGIDPYMLANYIRDVADNYHDNPFHNLHHATYVTQFAFMLIHATGVDKWLAPQQLFGVILSALVHDVDHPGNTNTFEINSLSYLSLLYNDQSVLENHHCSTAFLLMRRPTTNLFNGLSKPLSIELRKIIVSCIMATDMSVHFELVDETNRLVNETIRLVGLGEEVTAYKEPQVYFMLILSLLRYYSVISLAFYLYFLSFLYL